jgi:hypothetical protein
MKAGIYGGLSKYSHVSYIALLEAYDIFHHDFDFERIAGYHWVLNSSLPYLHTEIHSVIITLKWSAPQSSAHREELSVSCSARYSAGLRIPSAECGARVL